jgi:predicted esterase
MWTNTEVSMQSVKEQYAKLTDKYNIDTSKTIIGGFSMGGEISLRTALEGTVPVQGFILLAPSTPSLDEVEGLLAAREQGDKRSLRGYVMLGGDDLTISADEVGAVVERLNAAGISTHLGVLPGIAHRYPPNFDEVLAQGIAFIEQQS